MGICISGICQKVTCISYNTLQSSFCLEKERKSPGFEFTPLSRTFALAKEKMPGFKNVALHAQVCCL